MQWPRHGAHDRECKRGGTASHGGAVARERRSAARRPGEPASHEAAASGLSVVGTAVPRPAIPASLIPPARSSTAAVSGRPIPVPRSDWDGWVFYGLYGGLYGDPLWGGHSYGYPSAYATARPGQIRGLRSTVTLRIRRTVTGPRGAADERSQPKDAQVYVDGFYAGIVDDFNGSFSAPEPAVGLPPHRSTRPDHQPLAFDVNIEAHHTTVPPGTLPPLTP